MLCFDYLALAPNVKTEMIVYTFDSEEFLVTTLLENRRKYKLNVSVWLVERLLEIKHNMFFTPLHLEDSFVKG